MNRRNFYSEESKRDRAAMDSRAGGGEVGRRLDTQGNEHGEKYQTAEKGAGRGGDPFDG